MQAIRQSAGEIAAVTEGEIVVALGELAQMGFYVEPTCASAVAGLSQWLEKGVIGADEVTVVVLTGSGLKSGERIGQLLHLQPRLL